MPEILEHREEVTRITCTVHKQLEKPVVDCLRRLGTRTVVLENARCVRQSRRARRWGLPGSGIELHNAPFEIFRTTVPRESAVPVVAALAEAAELRTPGHGSIYAQDLIQISPRKQITPNVDADLKVGLLKDFALITIIFSLQEQSQELARYALKLGVAVPVVSLGVGMGIRDRMGLLRITVPPEKELVHLMVPAHDAGELQKLLIEEGRLDRLGGGFLYRTPVRMGIPDTLVRIGRQEHAATMEQLIAAMDELKRGTEWRKRFAGVGPQPDDTGSIARAHCEITFICSEGLSQELVRAAMGAGAQGATISRVRRLALDSGEGGIAARERGVLCVPKEQEKSVLEALIIAADKTGDPVSRLQVLNASAVFSHWRR